MRVDLLGQGGDAFAQCGREAGVFVGEGEGVEAAGLVVTGTVFQCSTRGQSPFDVQLAGEDAQAVGVVQRDGHQHVVRQDGGIQKLEGAVLAGFHRGDIAGQASELLAHLLSRLAMQPPQPGVASAILGAAFGIAFRLDPIQQPLVGRRVLLAQLFGTQTKGINHQRAARLVSQVTAIAVGAHEGWGIQLGGLFGCDDKACAVQLHAR